MANVTLIHLTKNSVLIREFLKHTVQIVLQVNCGVSVNVPVLQEMYFLKLVPHFSDPASMLTVLLSRSHRGSLACARTVLGAASVRGPSHGHQRSVPGQDSP